MNYTINKRKAIIGLLMATIVLLIVIVAFGCSSGNRKFDVSGKSDASLNEVSIINTIEDINNLVTDDEKLVIDYFGAYTWVVLYNEEGFTENMIYVYEFEDAQTAQDVVSVRKNELEQNRTMTVKNSRVIENYVVVDLCDTSFHNVTRNMLENNFKGLIVY